MTSSSSEGCRRPPGMSAPQILLPLVIRPLASLLLTLMVVGLVLSALSLTVVRYALPLADPSGHRLADALEARLGSWVRVGSASLRLDGLRPRLRMTDVVLSAPHADAAGLVLDVLELDIGLVSSLRTASLQITGARLIGADLSVRIDQDGRVALDGLEILRRGDPRALERFLGRGRLELVDSKVQLIDERMDGAGLRLEDLHLRFDNDRDHHALTLSAEPRPLDRDAVARVADSRMSPDRLLVIADLVGPPTEPMEWSGRVYASLDAASIGTGLDPRSKTSGPEGILADSLPRGLPGALPGGLAAHADRARLESWSRVRAGSLEQSLIRIDLAGLEVSSKMGTGDVSKPGTSSVPLQLERLRATARVRAHSDGWRIEVGDLGGRHQGRSLPRLDLDLLVTAAHRPERLLAVSHRLDLPALIPLLKASPWALPEPMLRAIAANPRGRLDDLILDVELDSGERPRWAVDVRAEGLGWDRSGSLPGVDGVGLQLRADQEGGEATLGSLGLRLDLNPLFDEPLELDRLSARLNWVTDSAGVVRVSARNLTLENADLRGRARFVVQIPVDGSGPELDLRASFEDGNGAWVRPYLPVGIMHPKLVDWLTRSLVSGRVSQADLVVRGPLGAYPFRRDEGRFELILDFEETVLDYLAGWPPIQGAAGQLRFVNESLSISLDRGRIYESSLADAGAEIPELWGVTQIRIHGEAEGPFADGLRVLGETPLSERLGRLPQVLSATGKSRLRLEIELPLNKSIPLGVAGRLSWPGPATLDVKGTQISLSRLGGELSFTERGLAADALEAELWGRPLGLSIRTLNPGNPETSATLIQGRSRTPVAVLAERFPSPLWDPVAGELDWSLDLTLRNQDVQTISPPLAFDLSSRLRGLSIDLPAPFGKPASALSELAVGGSLVPGRSIRIAGRLGEVAADLILDLGVSPERPLRGRARLGAESAPPADRDGVFFDGRVAELDLPKWRERLAAMAPRQPDADSREARTLESWLAGADLRVGRLELGGTRLTDVALMLEPSPSLAAGSRWNLDLRANELAGRLVVGPTVDTPIDVALERLDLGALLADSGGKAYGPGTPGDSNPFENLPDIEARVAELRWGHVPLGVLNLTLRSDSLGVHLPTIRLSGEGLMAAEGEADWRRSEGGGLSEVSMRIESADAGQVLKIMDSQSRLDDAPIKATVQLNWAGGLGDFRLAQAKGFMDLEIGAGRLLEVEPGVGRLLGVLNLSALKRRLSMDFSDFYGQGFAFEEMRGRIRVADGKADLDDFTIDGPSSRVIVSGLSDLVNQRFDQGVTVEPKLGSSIALASAVAGGPVVGAAVYLVDRLAGNPIDRLGRYRYRITGPWQDPDVRRIGWDPMVGGDSLIDPGGAPSREQNHFLD
jgi:uncharacterized protein (TIGR02099 family)